MVTVYTLGRAVIDAEGTQISPASARKFALLLRLSADGGREITRSVLHELIFPDQAETNARHSLRELVYQFRQLGVHIVSTSACISLKPDTVRIDFDHLLDVEPPDVACLTALQGGFLPGYAPKHSEAFSEWLEGYRARTTFRLLKTLVRELERARTVGDWRAMDRAARACLALDALNEEGTLALAELLAVGGAKLEAIRVLDNYLGEVGDRSRDLRIPAAILRRRISEQDPLKFRAPPNSPFVGRESQISMLRAHLGRAKTDNAQCVVISGEPGIGKSRLVVEFTTIAGLEGAAVVAVSAQPNDVHRPFGAFADCLPSLLSMRGSLGCAPETLSLLDRLHPRPGSDRNIDPEAVRDSEALCHSLTNAIVDLFDAICAEQPVVLTMEDIHWLDQMSLRVLVCLASKRKPRRLLALLTTRHLAAIPALAGNVELVDVIELQQLETRCLREMTSILSEFTGVSLDSEMRAWLEETSGGNPLFLETLFAHFASTGQRFAISPTLASLIVRRLDCLSPEAGATLRMCALLGKHATLETVIEAVELPRFTLLKAVAELESARLVKSDGLAIRPAHRLIAETSQEGLPPITKRLAHHCAATALELLLSTQQSTALLWDCAEHWIAANNPERALNAIRRCAARALEIGRPAEAAEVLNRATQLDLDRVDQLLVGRELVFAADAASEHHLVFRGLEILRRHRISSEHDDLEFAEFRACARAWYDAPTQEAKLLECIRAPGASSNHRVMAATWLLKHADIQRDALLANEAVKALETSTVESADEPIRLEFALIRDCTLGDIDQAATTARRLLAAARTTSPQISLSLQLNASVAFERCGLSAEAIEAATSLYFEAKSRGMHRIRARAAAFVAEQYFDDCEDLAAAEWFNRVGSDTDHMADISDDFAPSVAQLSYLLTIGRPAEARVLFDRMERAGSFSTGRVRLRWYRTLQERLRQLEQPDQVREFLQSAVDVESNTGMLGIADLEIATVCHSRLRLGQVQTARNLFEKYMAERSRGRTKLSRCLRDLDLEIMKCEEKLARGAQLSPLVTA